MSATATIETLARAADAFVGETIALRANVCEDAPVADRPIHVEALCEDAANLHEAACELRGALPDVAAASDRFLDADACLDGIDSRERMRELDEVLLPRGGAWHPWIGVMRDEVRRCRLAARDVANALIRSWREQGPELAGMHDIPRRSE
jgi:hypothetical protein